MTPPDRSIESADLNETFKSKLSLTEQERLKFAKQALCVLAVISVAVFVAYAISPTNKALIAIFEFVKIGVLPLVTLVVSFYFPSRERK